MVIALSIDKEGLECQRVKITEAQLLTLHKITN